MWAGAPHLSAPLPSVSRLIFLLTLHSSEEGGGGLETSNGEPSGTRLCGRLAWRVGPALAQLEQTTESSRKKVAHDSLPPVPPAPDFALQARATSPRGSQEP